LLLGIFHVSRQGSETPSELHIIGHGVVFRDPVITSSVMKSRKD
jgi:hypothetical protein